MVTLGLKKEAMSDVPTVVDLCSQYKINDNLLLKLSVENLGNKNNAVALNKMNRGYNDAEDEGRAINTTARSRTYIFGGEIRF
jgi:hemoglobin/transferrin/lactoferrin receptor protein